MHETLLTAEEVGTRLGLSPRTIYKWAGQKRIPALKVGGALRFRPSELDAWLGAPAPPAWPSPVIPSPVE